jgi:hypothetical protein
MGSEMGHAHVKTLGSACLLLEIQWHEGANATNEARQIKCAHAHIVCPPSSPSIFLSLP